MVNRKDAGDGSDETPSYVHLQLSWVSAIISIEIWTMLFDFFDPETVKSNLRGKVTFKKTKISAQTKRYRFTSDEIKHVFLHYLMSEVIKKLPVCLIHGFSWSPWSAPAAIINIIKHAAIRRTSDHTSKLKKASSFNKKMHNCRWDTFQMQY